LLEDESAELVSLLFVFDLSEAFSDLIWSQILWAMLLVVAMSPDLAGLLLELLVLFSVDWVLVVIVGVFVIAAAVLIPADLGKGTDQLV
jgi:cation transport ATPase